MKRTPWFSLLKHKPVREGWYEWRCLRFPSTLAVVGRKHSREFFYRCEGCQWRGLASPPKGRK